MLPTIIRTLDTYSLLQVAFFACASTDVAKPDSAASDADGDGSANADDCAPENPAVNPSADEICNNGLDDDCDGGAGECRLAGEVSSDGLAAVDLGDGDATRSFALANIDDLDGDGRQDLLVGSPYDAGEIGRIYVIASSQALPSSLSGAWASIEGSVGDAQYLGSRAEGVGDLDGDGRGDFVARAWLRENGDTDDAVVLGFGAISFGEHGASSALTRWEYPGWDLGEFISGGPDLTGDAVPDVAMSVSARVAVTEGSPPLVFLFSVPAASETGGPVAQIWNADSEGLRDASVSAADDVDGDGQADVIVGFPGGQLGQFDTAMVMQFSGPIEGHVAVADASQTAEMALGQNEPAVSAVGDVDNDGFPEVLVAQSHASIDHSIVGRAYLLSAGWPGRVLDAEVAIFGDSGLAHCVQGMGDIDGDGTSDLLLTNDSEDAAYLFYGPVAGTREANSAEFVVRAGPTTFELGEQCASGFDWNDDGRTDFALTSNPYYPNPATSQLFLVFGGGI